MKLGVLNPLFQIGEHTAFIDIFLGKLSKFSELFPKQLCVSSKRAKNKRSVRYPFVKIRYNCAFIVIIA